MKKKKLLLISQLMLVFAFSFTRASGQQIIKDWHVLAESPNMIDVAYKVVQCSTTSPTEVHLRVFNEKPVSDSAKFNVLITDPTSNQSFTTTIIKAMAGSSMVVADCPSNTAYSDLRITLPTSYSAASISVSLSFIP